jgi:hypothetical protein
MSKKQIFVSALVVALLGVISMSAQAQNITPLFSVRPETLTAGKANSVLLTVRTSSVGTLTPPGGPAADQFTFTFDAVGGDVLVANVDSSVTRHVGATSTLLSSDFQVTVSGLNQVSIRYVGASLKVMSPGETISLHATLTPQIAGAFSANVSFISALHNPLTQATGETLSFVDFPVGPQGPPGPAGTNQLTFNWSSTAGQIFQLQSNTNLLTTNWNNLGGTVTATGPITTASDAIGPAPQRFYRLEKLQ